MSNPVTPPASAWSTNVVATATGVRVTIMLTTDTTPMKEFRPFLDVDLDEAHATELLGNLMRGLADFRAGRQL
jgi:hypothetical protein